MRNVPSVPRLGLALAAAALGVCAACGTTGPAASVPTPTPAPPAQADAVLRVMTFNMHHGADADDRLDLDRIADVIRRERPHVVALQEVDRGVERSGRRDLLQELAQLTGLPHAAFGKNIDHQGGDYGNGILSRYPIIRHANSHLDQVSPGERRGVLQAVVDVDGREVAVLATHFDVRNAGERLLGVRQIREQILPGYEGTPVILTGDLNDVPGSEVYRELSALLSDAWTAVGRGPGNTIPVSAPTRRIDYVFHSRHLVPVAAHVPRTDASDHLPVVVDLRFAD